MKQLLKIRVGSHAFGTNIETSDEDFLEVHQCDNEELFGFNYRDELQFTKDHKSFELKKFLELLLKANPTTLEMLFSDESNIIYKDESLNWLFENKEMFVTKQSLQTFGNYAISQIQKATALDKKANWEKNRVIRKTPLDFCYILLDKEESVKIKDFFEITDDIILTTKYWGLSNINNFPDCYSMYYFKDGNAGFISEDSNELQIRNIPKELSKKYTLRFDRNAYSTHCKDFREYTEWLSKRNTQRYTWDQGKISYDLKNIMHCRRLLNVALEIAEKGTFTVLRPEAKDLIEIRRGNIKIEDIMKGLEDDKNKILKFFEFSKLPEKIDQKLIEDYLIKMRIEKFNRL
jgi:predicted nucleotidyltransferase